MDDSGETIPVAVAEARLFRSETISQALTVYLPATALFRLIGLGRNILLTWLMYSQVEFGLFALALVVINLLNPLCSLGLYEGVTRYTPAYETRHMLRAFLARVIPLVVGVAAITCALLMAVNRDLGPLLFQSVSLKPELTRVAYLRSVGLMMNVVYATFTLIVYFLALSVLKGLRMFRALSLMELTHGVVFTVLAILSVILGHRTATAVIACYMMSLWIALACFALPACLHLAMRTDQDVPLDAEPFYRKILAFSLWAAMAAVMWQGLQNYPFWYLNRVHGGDAAAVFGAMRTVTQYVVVAAAAVAIVVMTSVTKTWEAQGPRPAERMLSVSFKACALALLTGCAVLVLLRGPIVLLFDPRYRQGADLIPVLLLTFSIAGSLSFLSIHFTLIEKTRFLFWPWTVGLASNAFLGVVLVRELALHGRCNETILRIGFALRPWVVCGATSGTGSAAWTGAFALVIALLVCLVLLRAARRPVDLGSYVLIFAPAVLVLKWYLMVPALVALWLFALGTRGMFDDAEKGILAERLSPVFGLLRGGRR